MSSEDSGAIAELKEEVKSAVSTRLNSPFVGAFVFSWLAWNHRILFVLFSDMKVGKRFEFIDYEMYPTISQFLIFNIALPFISSFIYIVGVPWVTEWAHKYGLWMKRRLLAAELKSQDRTVMTEDQAADLRAYARKKHYETKEAKTSLAAAKAENRRLAAMHAFTAGLAEAAKSDALKAFLTSYRFATKQRVTSAAELSSHTFDSEGQVQSDSNGLRLAAEDWELTSNGLKLRDGAGELLVTFSFEPKRGIFEGSIYDGSYVLIPADPL